MTIGRNESGDSMRQLAQLRVEIDRIDGEMHALLMERGKIIDTLIEVKARQGGGSAFRPGREAEMMRRLAERHKGILPLDTAEGIWRIIIATFTYVQANYSIHVDASGGDPAMRDSARFHFGFTVPYVAHQTAGDVIDAVAASGGDLGMLRIVSSPGDGAWWRGLEGERRPKIIARLPFVERPGHPAGLPVFVISLPLNEAAATDVFVYSVSVGRWQPSLPERLAAIGAEILGNVGDANGLCVMVAAPGTVDAAKLRETFLSAGITSPRLALIGSHAARFEVASGTGRPLPAP